MRLQTRADLDAAVLGWLENRPADGELAQLLGVAVQGAEEAIANELRVRAMVVRVRQEIDDRYVTLPCDWLEALDIRLDSHALTQITRDASAATSQGGPARHYSIVGDQLEVIPAQGGGSAAPVSLELAYYARPAALLAPTDSNAVLREHGLAYLYGTLLHTAMVLRDDERVARWAGLFTAQRDNANLAWQRAQWSGGPLNARIRAA
jgi:hypothetical protein